MRQTRQARLGGHLGGLEGIARVAGSCVHQRSRRSNTASTEASPRVTLVATPSAGSNPQSRHSGWPSRCPCQSHKARSMAQRAGGLRDAIRGSNRCGRWGSRASSCGNSASSSCSTASRAKARWPVSNPPVSPRPTSPSRSNLSSNRTTAAVVPRLIVRGTALVSENRRRAHAMTANTAITNLTQHPGGRHWRRLLAIR